MARRNGQPPPDGGNDAARVRSGPTSQIEKPGEQGLYVSGASARQSPQRRRYLVAVFAMALLRPEHLRNAIVREIEECC